MGIMVNGNELETDADGYLVEPNFDDAASHAEFAKKHSLPFSLVPDTDHAWATAFGVSSKLGMYQRVSFLIDKKGKVARVYPDVDPGIHASQILADVLALGQ